MGTIEVLVEDSYAVVRMLGEGKFNPELLGEMQAALGECAANEKIQALILTGEAKNFSQGLDVEYLMTAAPDDAMTLVNDCMTMLGEYLTLPVPTVAAVNGHAFGLGAMLCLASDYKVMREDRGFFCLPEIDMGATLVESMNRLVLDKLPREQIRDVLLAGVRLGGVQAHQRGIVDACCKEPELLAAARQLAVPMMGKNRQAMAGLKRGVNTDVLAIIEAHGQNQTQRS